MITVAELKKELDKFPDDAVCIPYEGESMGITIFEKPDYEGESGFIYCDLKRSETALRETELFGERVSAAERKRMNENF